MNYVLEDLAWRVRVYTAGQVRRSLRTRPGGQTATRGVIQRLKRLRLIDSRQSAVAFVEPQDCLWTGSPGGPQPPYHALCWKLVKRWQGVQSRRVTLCWATDRGARLLGGVARFGRQGCQLEHDLGTAAVLVRLRQMRPDTADGWIGEDIVRRDFAPHQAWAKKVPDAAIMKDMVATKVIEFGGQYAAERLRRLHNHCARFRLAYELW